MLVWKLDRFARNRYDSAHYEYQLERNHVKLVSATEPISDSPAGIMVKSMLTGMAEYYSAELSEKVVRGMTENVLKGKYNGGTIPIGFKAVSYTHIAKGHPSFQGSSKGDGERRCTSAEV